MNKQETAEAILVMQDWIDGEEIQCKPRTFAETNWGNDKPMWNWSGYIYRTKPSPREFWIVDAINRDSRYPHVLTPEEKEKHFADSMRYIKVREVIK